MTTSARILIEHDGKTSVVYLHCDGCPQLVSEQLGTIISRDGYDTTAITLSEHDWLYLQYDKKSDHPRLGGQGVTSYGETYSFSPGSSYVKVDSEWSYQLSKEKLDVYQHGNLFNSFTLV